MKIQLKEIAALVGGTVVGDENLTIAGIAKLESASETDLCFLSNMKYAHYLDSTAAAAVIVPKDINDLPNGRTYILSDQPYVAFTKCLITYFDYQHPQKGISPSATISKSALIGEDVHIGPNVVIEEGVVIGDHSKIMANTCIFENSKIGSRTVIHSNVSIYYNSIIGDDCIIHSNSVIGSDGFGHAPLPDGSYIKIPQVGNVVIGNNVEIGSNCSIDRANMGSTVIKDGVKLDNLVQIAHGVEIGEHTVIAAQTGVSGSTKIGKYCVLGGQVGVAGHIEIADRVMIGAQGGVISSIKESGTKFTGTPHLPIQEAMRSRVLFKNLPKLEQRVIELEKKIK